MNSPSKGDKKQRLREWRDREELAKELARARRVDEDFCAPGVGRRCLQVLMFPSFERIHSWDVREPYRSKDGGFVLYHATGPADQDEMLDPGYRELVCPASVLAGFLTRLRRVQVPLVIPESNIAGLDGTTYEVALFGGMHASCRFRWWDDLAPDGWKELATITMDMVATFRSCRAVGE